MRPIVKVDGDGDECLELGSIPYTCVVGPKKEHGSQVP